MESDSDCWCLVGRTYWEIWRPQVSCQTSTHLIASCRC